MGILAATKIVKSFINCKIILHLASAAKLWEFHINVKAFLLLAFPRHAGLQPVSAHRRYSLILEEGNPLVGSRIPSPEKEREGRNSIAKLSHNRRKSFRDNEESQT